MTFSPIPIKSLVYRILSRLRYKMEPAVSQISGDEPPSKIFKSDTEAVSGIDDSTSTENLLKSFLSRPSPICEESVGITKFLGSHTGFSAILKNRYEDFIVREIDLSGKVLHVNDLSAPDVDEKPEVGELGLKELVGQEIMDQVTEFCSDKKSTINIKIDVTQMDKTQRQAIHKAVREHSDKLDSVTLDEDSEGKRFIGIIRKSQSNRFNNNSKNNRSWPSSKGDHVHFTMYKINRDTFDAINTIANMIHVKPRYFTFAGTKDKRAITCQRVSIRRVPPYKIANACHNIRPPIIVGDFTFEKEIIKLGDLLGNRFEIVLRDVTANSPKDIEESIKSIEQTGFINYYGMQRFGSKTVPSHWIGLCLLKGNYEAAVKLILRPKDFDKTPRKPGAKTFHQSLRQYEETGDASRTFKEMYYKGSIEGRILSSLGSHHQGKNFQSAIQSLPRPTKTLYGHAYQSFIWNMAASHRIETYGMQVVVGDLVLSDPAAERLELDLEAEGDAVPDDFDEEPPAGVGMGKGEKAMYVDESNISKYSIYDIVLPLPGSDILLPQHSTGQFISDLLKKDGFDPKTFASNRKMFALWGGYRKLLQKAQDVEWKTVTYTDPSLGFIETEQDKFGIRSKNGVDVKTASEQKSDANGSDDAGPKEPLPADKMQEYTAVIAKLTLPKSCYATMAFREILKREDYICYNIQH